MINQNDPKKRGKASRNKGANAERELSHILNEKYGLDTKRGQCFNHQSDLIGLAGIHPEVKRVEKLNIHKAMEQADMEAIKRMDGLPTVFHRRDREEWLVTMRLEDWMNLYRSWDNGK